MPPAVIGGVIAGVGAIGASVIGSKANSKAIGQASDAQAQAAKEATQLQREIYNQNVGYQTPYLNTGNAAMAQINALLGLQVPQAATGVQTGGTNALPEAPMPVGGGFLGTGIGTGRFIIQKVEEMLASGQQVPENMMALYQQFTSGQQGNGANPANPANPVPQVSQVTAQDAYNQFKNYTGYQTRLDEANNAMNSGYAAKGSLQSGAALQAMAKMNQDYASQEFGNYMGYLGGQQQLGPGAANALAGVGTNYANNAGNIAMQQGNNLANAAIARANNTNQMWSGIAGGIGGMAGSIFGGSSYSDRRLKTKITKVGERSDGLNVYQWVYKFDPSNTVCEGFMADEVKEIYPDAYIENWRHGYAGVNYGKIPAEEVAA